jgi:quercetin dioxygenase-like cupin family protein
LEDARTDLDPVENAAENRGVDDKERRNDKPSAGIVTRRSPTQGGAAVKYARKRAVVATVGFAVCGVAAAAAVASPPFQFFATNLVAEAELTQRVHLNSDRVKFQTKGPVDVRVQEVNVAPGGRSGWHHHPGMVIVAVQTGAVTVVHSDCSGTTYGVGSPNGSVFVESGDEPAEVRNATDQPAKLYATFVAPDADPGVFRIEDAPIC